MGINIEINGGVVALIADDKKNELILDYYEDLDGREMLEIEYQGLHWSDLDYQVLK